MKKKMVSAFVTIMAIVSLAGCGRNVSTNDPDSSAALDKEAAAEGSKESTAEYTLKLGHTLAVDDNMNIAAQMFADAVYEGTDGAVKIEVYPAGQLGSTSEEAEAVGSGYQDIFADAINTLDGYNPLADVECYPFLFSSSENLVAFLDSDLSQELFDEVGKEQFKILGAQFRGARYLQTTKEVRSLDDLKGLKLRTPTSPVMLRPWEILGATTTPMDFTEVYTGLQQGTIEGQENPLGTSYASGFAEVEKYVIQTRHVYGIMAFIFNYDVFNNLPEEYQAVIEEAAREAADWRTQTEIENEEKYIEQFKEAGVEYVVLEDWNVWKDTLVEPMQKEFPELQPWVERINSFQSSL